MVADRSDTGVYQPVTSGLAVALCVSGVTFSLLAGFTNAGIVAHAAAIAFALIGVFLSVSKYEVVAPNVE